MLLSRVELHLLVATDFRNLDSFELKSVMMQDVEETLPKALDKGFLAADSGVKYAFFALWRRHYQTWHIVG